MLLEHNPCFLISEMGYQCCIALSCVNTADLPQGPYQHEDTISQSSPVSGLSLNRSSGLLHTFRRQAWKTKSSLKNYNKHIKMKNFSRCFFTLLCCLEMKQFPPLFSKYLSGLSFYNSKILLPLESVKIQQVPKIRCPGVQFCIVINLLDVTSLVC